MSATTKKARKSKKSAALKALFKEFESDPAFLECIAEAASRDSPDSYQALMLVSQVAKDMAEAGYDINADYEFDE